MVKTWHSTHGINFLPWVLIIFPGFVYCKSNLNRQRETRLQGQGPENRQAPVCRLWQSPFPGRALCRPAPSSEGHQFSSPPAPESFPLFYNAQFRCARPHSTTPQQSARIPPNWHPAALQDPGQRPGVNGRRIAGRDACPTRRWEITSFHSAWAGRFSVPKRFIISA